MSEPSTFAPRGGQRGETGHKAGKTPKKGRNLVLNILLVIFGAVFVFAAYKLISQYLVYQEAVGEYEGVRQVAGVGDQVDARPDFAALAAVNPDIVGWVTVPGTAINYPVVQTTNNEKYLHTTFEGTRNGSGCVFMDKDSQKDGGGQHTILYGHNMKNGSMFHDLVQYKTADFFTQHRTIYFDTPEGRTELRVIAAYAADAGETYNYNDADVKSFRAFLKKAAAKSPVQVDDVALDEVTTAFSLQTCSYETDNARTYVLAVPVSFQP